MIFKSSHIHNVHAQCNDGITVTPISLNLTHTRFRQIVKSAFMLSF